MNRRVLEGVTGWGGGMDGGCNVGGGTGQGRLMLTAHKCASKCGRVWRVIRSNTKATRGVGDLLYSSVTLSYEVGFAFCAQVVLVPNGTSHVWKH